MSEVTPGASGGTPRDLAGVRSSGTGGGRSEATPGASGGSVLELHVDVDAVPDGGGADDGADRVGHAATL